MRWLQYWLTVWIFLGASALSGTGQDLPGWFTKDNIPKPPDFGIRDESGFFNRNSGALKRISDQIRQLEADHGYRIYLIVEPVLIASTPQELAAQLRQAWLPKGDGLVVVYESDSRRLGLGRDFGGGPDSADPVCRVPTHETAALLQKAMAATDLNLAPEAYIETLMGNLVGEFDGYFDRRAAPRPTGRTLRIGLLTLGALALVALAAIGVGALVRLPSMATSRKFRFPLVDRPERLGAPCGGGNVTTRRFRSGPRS